MVGYIGKEPTVGNFIKLDSITTSATTTFNLLNGGVAYSPESARVCLVSLNGVIQNPETSFNIVGSTIVFSEALTSSDVIDYILVLGDTLSVGIPSDSTISTAKIVDDAVTTAKINNDAVTTDKILNDAVTIDKINLITTSSAPSLEAKGSGSNSGKIILNCENNSHGVSIQAPAHADFTGNYTLTLPTSDGNADQILKSNGSGVLSWTDQGGGAYEKLLTTTASDVASVAFSSTYITSTYRDYKIIMSDVDAYTAGQRMYIHLSSNNGVSYLGGSAYDYAVYGYASTPDTSYIASDGAGQIVINGHTMGNDDRYNLSGEINLVNPLSTSTITMIYGQNAFVNNSGKVVTQHFSGFQNDESLAINNIKISIESGNITSGTFTLYGRKN